MQATEVKLFINDIEQTLQVQEDKTSGNFIVSQDFKFITRMFRDADGRWKSVEISDLSPSVIEAIGNEFEKASNL